jgi:hypothetical protein
MAPIPVPIINASQTPTPSLPSFSTPLPGEEGGFCGLTGEQWRYVVLLVVLPCEFDLQSFPPICSVLMRSVSTHAFRSVSRPRHCPLYIMVQ